MYGLPEWTQLKCLLKESDWQKILALGIDQDLLSHLPAVIFSGIFFWRHTACKIPCSSLTCLLSDVFNIFQDIFLTTLLFLGILNCTMVFLFFEELSVFILSKCIVLSSIQLIFTECSSTRDTNLAQLVENFF